MDLERDLREHAFFLPDRPIYVITNTISKATDLNSQPHALLDTGDAAGVDLNTQHNIHAQSLSLQFELLTRLCDSGT